VYPRSIGAKQRPGSVLRGRASYPRFALWCEELQPEGTQSLSSEVKAFARSASRPGLVVLVSDAMDPEASQAVRILAGRGHEVCVVQTLSDVELRPDLEGDLRLLDVEGPSAVEITANSITLRAYEQNLRSHNTALQEAALRAGGRYTLVEVGTPLDRVVKETLKKEGWVAA
jgi:hypothetical protein